MCSIYGLNKNKTQVDNAKDIGVIMPTYNLKEYGDNYSKTWKSLWQYYRDEPLLNNLSVIVPFTGNIASKLINFERTIMRHTGNDSTKFVEIMV